MRHALTDIRNAAVNVLQTGFQRVYVARSPQMVCPCVLVQVDGRRSEKIAMSPIAYQHDVNLAIVICVQDNSNADDLASQMLGEVETLLLGRRDLGIPHIVKALDPTTLRVEQDDTGEINTLYYQQIFRVTYFQDT